MEINTVSIGVSQPHKGGKMQHISLCWMLYIKMHFKFMDYIIFLFTTLEKHNISQGIKSEDCHNILHVTGSLSFVNHTIARETNVSDY